MTDTYGVINICGIPHKVVRASDYFDVDTHFGMIDYKTCTIKINKDLEGAMEKETSCHEVMHGIFVHIGRQDLATDEQFVQSLANAISQSFDVKMERD